MNRVLAMQITVRTFLPICSFIFVQNAVLSIAKVEEAYKQEKQTKAAIEKAIHLLSFNDLEDAMDAADEDVDENRLLPAMNKIWPYFIICLKNKISVVLYLPLSLS